MNKLSIREEDISKLTLGTVALGMEYGISNPGGQPDPKTISGVLSTALKLGITSWDTARHYGNAEQIIGDYALQHDAGSSINIVTKFRISTENLDNITAAREEVYESIKTSLQNLHCQSIPVCLFHKRPGQPVELVVKVLPEIIRNLQSDGLIGLGGVSAFHPDEIPFYLDVQELKAIQLPVNIFDQRLVHNNMMKYLGDEEKIVFARSVFLQGLFFLSPGMLEGNLVGAAVYIKELHGLCKRTGLDIARIAFLYVRDMPEITSIVFGAVSKEQVNDIAGLLSAPPLPAEIREEIEFIFKAVPEDVITPGFWKT